MANGDAGETGSGRPFVQRRFASYVLTEQISSGAPGDVFRGFEADHAEPRPVVVRMLLPYLSSRAEFRESFTRHAELNVALEHPGLVQVYEYGEQDDRLYVVTEYVEATSMGRLMLRERQAGRPLPLSAALHMTMEALRALDFAHNAHDLGGVPLEVVHGEITPGRILVGYDGRVRVREFGLMHGSPRLAVSWAGMHPARLRFLAPEQLDEERIDRRADVFAMAVVLVEAIAGRPLFRGATDLTLMLAVRQADVQDAIDGLADAPPELRSVLLRALARDRDERYQSAAAFYRGLERVARQYGLQSLRSDLAAWVTSLMAGVRQAPLTRPAITAPIPVIRPAGSRAEGGERGDEPTGDVPVVPATAVRRHAPSAGARTQELQPEELATADQDITGSDVVNDATGDTGPLAHANTRQDPQALADDLSDADELEDTAPTDAVGTRAPRAGQERERQQGSHRVPPTAAETIASVVGRTPQADRLRLMQHFDTRRAGQVVQARNDVFDSLEVSGLLNVDFEAPPPTLTRRGEPSAFAARPAQGGTPAGTRPGSSPPTAAGRAAPGMSGTHVAGSGLSGVGSRGIDPAGVNAAGVDPGAFPDGASLAARQPGSGDGAAASGGTAKSGGAVNSGGGDASGLPAPGVPDPRVRTLSLLATRALEEDPQSPVARAVQLRLEGRTDAALAVLEDVGIADDPLLERLERGLCHGEAGSWELALACLEPLVTAGRLPPRDHALALYFLALAYEGRGRSLQARPLFELLGRGSFVSRFPDLAGRLARIAGG